jgi:hypothetical protein
MYYNKRILDEFDMEERREAAEAVAAPYFKRPKNSYVNCNITIAYIVLVAVDSIQRKCEQNGSKLS